MAMLGAEMVHVVAGERLVARGRVLRPGRTLTVCRGDAFAIDDGREKHVATLTTTMMARVAGPAGRDIAEPS